MGRVCSINPRFWVHSVIISAKRKKIKEGFPKEVTFDMGFFFCRLREVKCVLGYYPFINLARF